MYNIMILVATIAHTEARCLFKSDTIFRQVYSDFKGVLSLTVVILLTNLVALVKIRILAGLGVALHCFLIPCGIIHGLVVIIKISAWSHNGE